MNQPDTLENKAKSMMILAMLIFGTIGIFVRYIPLPSSVIAVGRGIIGTAFLFLFIKGKGIPISWPDIRQNLLLLCLSGAALCGNWTFLFEAYRYTSIATATLCYYMAPIIVILVSPIFLKEKLTARKFLCVLTALAGMVLVSGIGQEGGSANMTGVFFGLCAACCYACIVIFNKKIKPMAAYDKTIVQLGLGALLLMPYVLLTENSGRLSLQPGHVPRRRRRPYRLCLRLLLRLHAVLKSPDHRPVQLPGPDLRHPAVSRRPRRAPRHNQHHRRSPRLRLNIGQ